MSTNGAIADGGDRAGGGGGGRCGGGRVYDNFSREEGGMRWGMRWLVLPLHRQPKSSVFETYVMAGGAKFFLRRREGQTAHYGRRKVLRCAAGKATLLTRSL